MAQYRVRPVHGGGVRGAALNGRQCRGSDGQGRRALRHGQGKVRSGAGYRGVRQQRTHEEAVVVGYIGHHNPQQVIPFARHGKALDDFRAAVHERFEGLARGAGMATHPHVAEHVDASVDFGGVHQADRLGQDAALFQRFDTAPARGARGAHFRCQIGVADGSVLLQQRNDLAVDEVET